jgi:uncharacterized protein (TIGR02757 family)
MGKAKFSRQQLFELLESKVEQFNRPDFISDDPVSIPHAFSKRQDIEISGFFAAVLAWGQRVTIIRKCKELMLIMDNDPYQFILHHSTKDLKPFLEFKHRTFNATDTLYFIAFLKWFYQKHDSLSKAFFVQPFAENVEGALVHFQEIFFSLKDSPGRTRKHVPSPERKSTCKRLNMYLRWMVRQDNKGVDFGLWKEIKPGQLICPCDLHVDRVGRMLNLISRKQTDWQTALELTHNLKKFDPIDPVKYDFALFGMGVSDKLKI